MPIEGYCKNVRRFDNTEEYMEESLMSDNWVAVTGVSGFVGSYIAHELKTNGYSVLSLSRTVPTTPVDKHIAVDISDGAAMAELIADLPQLRCVVNCAA